LIRVLVPGFVVAATLAIMSSAEASHPYQPIHRWRDLEAGGDGTVTYRLCGSPIQAEWTAGIESWDFALGTSMQMDEVLCGS
jgi:hypothetical protein